MQPPTARAIVSASLLTFSGVLYAGESLPEKLPAGPGSGDPAKADKSPFDELWGLATLYKDDTNPFIKPTYDLLPKKLQLVGRYTFSTGDGPDSVFAQMRYERSAPGLTGGGKGENYHAGYLGLQYFIFGDRLKLLAGAEYARPDGGGNGGDFDGLTVLTGVRLSFQNLSETNNQHEQTTLS